MGGGGDRSITVKNPVAALMGPRDGAACGGNARSVDGGGRAAETRRRPMDGGGWGLAVADAIGSPAGGAGRNHSKATELAIPISAFNRYAIL